MIDDKANIAPPGNIQKGAFIFLLLLSLHFWNLRGIPQKVTIEDLFVWLICGISFLLIKKKSYLHFSKPILLFIMGLFTNIVAAYINLGQSPKLTFFAFSWYYYIVLYFALHYLKLNRKFLENTILIFAVIYTLLFTVQYKIYPTLIFNNDPRTAADSLQLEILGHGFLMLGLFLALNKFLINQKIGYLVLYFAFLIIQSKSGFRTLLGGAILVSGLMFLRMFRLNTRYLAIIFLFFILLVGLLQYRGFIYTINRMVTETENNLQQGKDYVRLIQLEFFLKRYPQNFSYYIIGGGKPAGENLWIYTPYVMGLDYNGNYNIVWVDIGLIGFYIVVGGIALAGLLWYVTKSIFVRLPRNALYLNAYFLYLLVVSFTNEEIYRNGIFSVQAIGLYLIDLTLIENRGDANRTMIEKEQALKSQSTKQIHKAV